MTSDCDWKRTYQTLGEAEDAYHRTPIRNTRPGALLPYWCEAHAGYHLGHFSPLGQRAYQGWGAAVYAAVNAYARVRRKGDGK